MKKNSSRLGHQSSPAAAQDQAATHDNVDKFLSDIKQSTPLASQDQRGKLIFCLDATASRQATWDRASALQGDMFVKTRGIGELDIQLAYYRGYDECKASPWLSNPAALLRLMKKITCIAGRTQISRILKHGIAEAKQNSVQAMVFIGDCVEEDIDQLGDLAGQLRLLNLPVFVFQEGLNATASMAFSQIARISGGAHCRFDHHSAEQLGQLLNAVAVYAAGGRSALQQLSSTGSRQASQLLQQLP